MSGAEATTFGVETIGDGGADRRRRRARSGRPAHRARAARRDLRGDRRRRRRASSIDLSEATFIDSMTLGVLLGALKRLRPVGRQRERRLLRPAHPPHLRDHPARPGVRAAETRDRECRGPTRTGGGVSGALSAPSLPPTVDASSSSSRPSEGYRSVGRLVLGGLVVALRASRRPRRGPAARGREPARAGSWRATTVTLEADGRRRTGSASALGPLRRARRSPIPACRACSTRLVDEVARGRPTATARVVELHVSAARRASARMTRWLPTATRLRTPARGLSRRRRRAPASASSSATCRSCAASPPATPAAGEPLEDLVQVGSIGLLLAIERFDTERGVQFTTYAVPTIVGEIQRHFRDRAWALHVPRRMKELSLRLTRTVESATADLGRAPDDRRARRDDGHRRGRGRRGARDLPRVLDALAVAAARPRAAGDETMQDVLGDDERGYEEVEDGALVEAGTGGARRARARDRRAALLRGADAVGDRRAGRHLADARLAPAPPRARDDAGRLEERDGGGA